MIICAEYASITTNDGGYSFAIGTGTTASNSYGSNTNYANEVWIAGATSGSGGMYSSPGGGYTIGDQAAITGSTSLALLDQRVSAIGDPAPSLDISASVEWFLMQSQFH